MKIRLSKTLPVAAAQAAISVATVYRIQRDPRLPSDTKAPRERRRPDPLVDIFEAEVVPLLLSAPGIRPVAIFDELRRRHAELDASVRRTLERRIRSWRALHGQERDVMFLQTHEAGRMGLWQGQGPASLGLSGAVQAAEFRAVLQGMHPHANQAITGSGSGATAHRAGWDCTFSAPKSVSVLWALSDEQTRLTIEKAHESAISAALGYLEAHAAFTRRGHGGIEQEAVKGLISATFKHFTSRAGDPQLHTHCIVMNMAPREDGSFGTIDSKHLYDHKMAAGAIYRMALGTALVQQGYDLVSSQHHPIKRRWQDGSGRSG